MRPGGFPRSGRRFLSMSEPRRANKLDAASSEAFSFIERRHGRRGSRLSLVCKPNTALMITDLSSPLTVFGAASAGVTPLWKQRCTRNAGTWGLFDVGADGASRASCLHTASLIKPAYRVRALSLDRGSIHRDWLTLTHRDVAHQHAVRSAYTDP